MAIFNSYVSLPEDTSAFTNGPQGWSFFVWNCPFHWDTEQTRTSAGLSGFKCVSPGLCFRCVPGADVFGPQNAVDDLFHHCPVPSLYWWGLCDLLYLRFAICYPNSWCYPTVLQSLVSKAFHVFRSKGFGSLWLCPQMGYTAYTPK